MGDYDALLATVLADPADDLPRLVMADWLDEHGQSARAEFIRVQCEYAKHFDPHEFAPLGMPYRQRIRELLEANFGSWTDGLPDSIVTKPCPHCEEGSPDWETGIVECRQCESTGAVADMDNVEFSRGFIVSVSGPLSAFWGERECGRCNGFGIVARPRPDGVRVAWQGTMTDRCPDCRAGRVSGPTPALVELVRREPVERIEVTDREPLETFTPGQWRWWAQGERPTEKYEIPRQLFVALPGGEPNWTHLPADRQCRDYPTGPAARGALSAAILGAAREMASVVPARAEAA